MYVFNYLCTFGFVLLVSGSPGNERKREFLSDIDHVREKYIRNNQRPSNQIWNMAQEGYSRHHLIDIRSFRNLFFEMLDNPAEMQLLVENLRVLLLNLQIQDEKSGIVKLNFTFTSLDKNYLRIDFWDSVNFVLDILDDRTLDINIPSGSSRGRNEPNSMFQIGLERLLNVFSWTPFNLVVGQRHRFDDPGSNYDTDVLSFLDIEEVEISVEMNHVINGYFSSELESDEHRKYADKLYRLIMLAVYKRPVVFQTNPDDWTNIGPVNWETFARRYLENRCSLQSSSSEFQRRLQQMLNIGDTETKGAEKASNELLFGLWIIEVKNFCKCNKDLDAEKVVELSTDKTKTQWGDIIPCCKSKKFVSPPTQDFITKVRRILQISLDRYCSILGENGKNYFTLSEDEKLKYSKIIKGLTSILENENEMDFREYGCMIRFMEYEESQGESRTYSHLEKLRPRIIRAMSDNKFGDQFWNGTSLDRRYNKQFRLRFSGEDSDDEGTTTIPLLNDGDDDHHHDDDAGAGGANGNINNNNGHDGHDVDSDRSRQKTKNIFDNSCTQHKKSKYESWSNFIMKMNVNEIPNTGFIEFGDGTFVQEIVASDMKDPGTWNAIDLSILVGLSSNLLSKKRSRRDLKNHTHGLLVVDKNKRPVVVIFKTGEDGNTVKYFWNGNNWSTHTKYSWQHIMASGISPAVLNSPRFERCNGIPDFGKITDATIDVDNLVLREYNLAIIQREFQRTIRGDGFLHEGYASWREAYGASDWTTIQELGEVMSGNRFQIWGENGAFFRHVNYGRYFVDGSFSIGISSTAIRPDDKDNWLFEAGRTIDDWIVTDWTLTNYYGQVYFDRNGRPVIIAIRRATWCLFHRCTWFFEYKEGNIWVWSKEEEWQKGELSSNPDALRFTKSNVKN